MKDKRLAVQINKPIYEVFACTTNSKNTPLWIDSIIYEETNEWPVGLGNRNIGKLKRVLEKK